MKMKYYTVEEVRDMPEDPNWIPRGIRWNELKHPKAAFMGWCHSRWDGARWDVLTLLRLRRPVRTSDELLSYVTRIEGMPDNTVKTDDIQILVEIHAAILKQLQELRRVGGDRQ
jgi:hypothetical protein